MERAEVHTVATATAKVLIISDKAQPMMFESTGRANLNAGSIRAVHAGSAVKEPVYFSPPFHLPELYLEPSLRREFGWIFVATTVGRLDSFITIPLLTRHLTGTASGAQR